MGKRTDFDWEDSAPTHPPEDPERPLLPQMPASTRHTLIRVLVALGALASALVIVGSATTWRHRPEVGADFIGIALGLNFLTWGLAILLDPPAARRNRFTLWRKTKAGTVRLVGVTWTLGGALFTAVSLLIAISESGH